jgi:hypothetical protein
MYTILRTHWLCPKGNPGCILVVHYKLSNELKKNHDLKKVIKYNIKRNLGKNVGVRLIHTLM